MDREAKLPVWISMVEEFFDEDESEKANATWGLLAETIVRLQSDQKKHSVSLCQLFAPPLSENLAAAYIALRREQGLAVFLSDERLHEIADEAMIPGRVGYETNINQSPGVYVFVSLASQEILKVGETDNFRERIATGHLRYGSSQPQSNLIGYLKSTNGAWPRCLLDDEVNLIMLPMPASNQKERWIVELGLQRLLCPVMK